MRTHRNLLAFAVAVVCCAIVAWFSTSIHGSERSYEVEPQITIPEYRTDAARAIDAYERLMERYMSLTEGNLDRIGIDIQSVLGKLDSINAKLAELSTRMARIEVALGIEQPKPPAEIQTQLKSIPEEVREKLLPPVVE
jgi:hypothetical protein